MSFSPDGRRIASGSEDDTALIRSASDGQWQQRLSDGNKWAGIDSWIWSGLLSPQDHAPFIRSVIGVQGERDFDPTK